MGVKKKPIQKFAYLFKQKNLIYRTFVGYYGYPYSYSYLTI